MKKLFIYLTLLFLAFSCDNDPLITELIDNKMSVIIKGTYTSGTPRIYTPAAGDPTKFRLDIAQFSLNKDVIGHIRETFTFDYRTDEAFFNGTGITLQNDDLYHEEEYSKLKIYFRKMIFNEAVDGGSTVTTIFKEEEVDGFDFNEYQAYTQADYDDYEANGSSLNNLVFPARYTLPESFKYDREKEFVLEIRIFVMNNIKEYTGMDSDLPDSFYALNDFNSPTAAGDKYIGGNLRMVARVYRTDQIASITGSETGYVAVVPTGDNPGNYDIPPIVLYNASGTYEIKNVPIGQSYDIFTSGNTPSTQNMTWTGPIRTVPL